MESRGYGVLMTNAATLRTALKNAGYSSRKVTVRDRGGSLETSLLVTIRDASVSLSAVTKIAAPFENIHRDGYGEILGGGNTFLTVEYADALVEPIKTAFAAEILAAPVGNDVDLGDGFSARKIPARDATYADEVEIGGPGFDSDRRNIACGVYFAAKRLSIAWLDAQAQSKKAA